MDLAGIRAYAAASQTANRLAEPAQPEAAPEAQAPNFGNLVSTAVGQVEDSVRTAEQMSVQAATGQADLVDVVTAVAAAEVQLETVVAVRDQVIRAYQEILRMPI